MPTAEERLRKIFPDIVPEDFEGLLLLNCMLGVPELYDEAIIGIGDRCGQKPVLVYDGTKLEEIDSGLSGSEDYDTYGSVTGAWMGDQTPIVITARKE
jgi:hypothetical protein